MSDENKAIEKLKSIMSEAAPKHKSNKGESPPITPNSISIAGDGNVIGDGNTVNNIVHLKKTVRRPLTPPAGSITNAQAAELKSLVDEIGRLEIDTKLKPRSFAAIWTAFKRRMNVTSYHVIAADKFDEAKQYLLQERGKILNSSKAKARLGGEFINSRMRSIHARCREFTDGEQKRISYMIRNFGVNSMTKLNADQVDQLYRYVMGWKRK